MLAEYKIKNVFVDFKMLHMLLLDFVQYAIQRGVIYCWICRKCFCTTHICYRFSWWNESASRTVITYVCILLLIIIIKTKYLTNEEIRYTFFCALLLCRRVYVDWQIRKCEMYLQWIACTIESVFWNTRKDVFSIFDLHSFFFLSLNMFIAHLVMEM